MTTDYPLRPLLPADTMGVAPMDGKLARARKPVASQSTSFRFKNSWNHRCMAFLRKCGVYFIPSFDFRQARFDSQFVGRPVGATPDIRLFTDLRQFRHDRYEFD